MTMNWLRSDTNPLEFPIGSEIYLVPTMNEKCKSILLGKIYYNGTPWYVVGGPTGTTETRHIYRPRKINVPD